MDENRQCTRAVAKQGDLKHKEYKNWSIGLQKKQADDDTQTLSYKK